MIKRTDVVKFDNGTEITIHWGWSWAGNAGIELDDKGRIIGYKTRIRDSDGRDEMLPSIIRIIYDDPPDNVFTKICLFVRKFFYDA